MIRIKPGASLDNVHPKIFYALSLAAPVWAVYNSKDLWVTAANETGHSSGNRGYHHLPDDTCQAADIRTSSIPFHLHRVQACKDLAKLLGPEFDVLFEEEIRDNDKIIRGEHCHVQYDLLRLGTKEV